MWELNWYEHFERQPAACTVHTSYQTCGFCIIFNCRIPEMLISYVRISCPIVYFFWLAEWHPWDSQHPPIRRVCEEMRYVERSSVGRKKRRIERCESAINGRRNKSPLVFKMAAKINFGVPPQQSCSFANTLISPIFFSRDLEKKNCMEAYRNGRESIGRCGSFIDDRRQQTRKGFLRQ